MKRVTILVDDIGETDEDGERLLAGLRAAERPLGLEYVEADVYVAADRVLSVEDHVEPLPTEPGARFWGRLGDDEPQWWFVRKIDRDILGYLPTRGAGVWGDNTQGVGLVRLSDPKPTETAGDAR